MQHEVSELYRSLHFICNIFLNSIIRQILRYINHQGNIQSEHKRRRLCWGRCLKYFRSRRRRWRRCLLCCRCDRGLRHCLLRWCGWYLCCCWNRRWRCCWGCICIQSCYCCFARAHILSCCWFLWRRSDCSTTITCTTAKRRICRTMLCCTSCYFVTVFTSWEIILKIPYDNKVRIIFKKSYRYIKYKLCEMNLNLTVAFFT